MERWDLAIVGAGIAGISAAKAWRTLRPDDRILLLDGEDAVPYKRTKLSKIIADGTSIDDIHIEDESFFDHVHLILGYRVEGIDSNARVLALENNERHQYGVLLLATGAQAWLPQIARDHIDEISVFRNAHDLEKLKLRLGGAKKVVIFGAGILGLEIADQIQALGKKTILVGSGPMLMARELSPRASELLESRVQASGVELRFQDELISLSKRKDARLQLGFLHSSESVADLALFCTGSRPALELAHAAGCACDRGILVNSSFETSVEGIWAAGDCIELPGARVTHLWHESEHQGTMAGTLMAQSVSGGFEGQEKPVWDNRLYRIKGEFFGTYVWSMVDPDHKRTLDMIEFETSSVYYALFLERGLIRGIIMLGDKDRNKIYEQAVVESWTPALLAERLEQGA